VGLSQVSKDCRITFFSKAARIWSHGLSAETGEIANAIEQILTCVAYQLRERVHPSGSRNSLSTGERGAHRSGAAEDLPDSR
jgi:hypothetical protein